jgi:hypothetical protein
MPSGGRRTGAGRKADSPEGRRVTLQLRVLPSTREKLMAAAREAELPVGRLMDEVAAKL